MYGKWPQSQDVFTFNMLYNLVAVLARETVFLTSFCQHNTNVNNGDLISLYFTLKFKRM